MKTVPQSLHELIVEAERQGFDDGYFRNPKSHPQDSGMIAAYTKGYNDGQSQRTKVDRAEKKVKVKV